MWAIIKQLIDTKQITDDQWSAMDKIAAKIYDDPQMVTPPNVIDGDDMSMAEVIATAYEERLTGRELDGMGPDTWPPSDPPQWWQWWKS
jgi:hypothetical protein